MAFRVAVIGSGTTGLAAALGLMTVAARLAAHQQELEIVLLSSEADALDPKAPSALDTDVRAIDLWPTAFAALARLGNGCLSKRASDGPEDARAEKYLPRVDERITGFWRDDKGESVRKGGVGYELERYDFRSTTGQLLWSMPAGTYGRDLGSAPRVLTLAMVHQALRGTLRDARQALLEEVEDQGPVANEKARRRLQAVVHKVKRVLWHADASYATVEPVDGSPTLAMDFDLVVVADGASATVHRTAQVAWGTDPTSPEDREKRLFPDTHASRRVTHTAVVSGLVQVEDAGADLTRFGQGVVMHGQDLRFGAWCCPNGATDGHVRWNAFVPRHVAVPVARGTFGDGHDGDAEEAFAARLHAARRASAPTAADAKLSRDLRDRLREAFAAFPDTVDRLIALTLDPDLSVHLPTDRAPDRAHWVAGRVVLLGDSAHPMLPDLGLACTMAFEDAAALAETLERLGHEHDGLPGRDPEGDERLGEALAAWRDGRFSRVSEVVSSSRIAHETVHAPVDLPQWARDLLIATMTPPAAAQGKEKWFTPG